MKKNLNNKRESNNSIWMNEWISRSNCVYTTNRKTLFGFRNTNANIDKNDSIGKKFIKRMGKRKFNFNNHEWETMMIAQIYDPKKEKTVIIIENKQTNPMCKRYDPIIKKIWVCVCVCVCWTLSSQHLGEK